MKKWFFCEIKAAYDVWVACLQFNTLYFFKNMWLGSKEDCLT